LHGLCFSIFSIEFARSAALAPDDPQSIRDQGLVVDISSRPRPTEGTRRNKPAGFIYVAKRCHGLLTDG
jgi:hypothetical protein